MENKKVENKLVPYQKQAGLLLEEANALTIKTEVEIKKASDVLTEVISAQEKIQVEKERLTAPAREILDWANGVFNPLIAKFKFSERLIKSKMLDFDKKQEDKNKKKLAKIAEKVAEGKIDIDKASKKIEDLAPVKSYAGDIGGVQIRQNRKPVITDLSKLPRKYLKPDSTLIRQDLFKGIKIPGVELIIEKTIAKKRA